LSFAHAKSPASKTVSIKSQTDTDQHGRADECGCGRDEQSEAER
jgi:hypothetical protein